MVRKDGKVMRVALSESHGVSLLEASQRPNRPLALEHLEVDEGVRC